MAQAILLTTLIILAVIGLTQVIRGISGWILTGGKKQYLLSIVPCDDKIDTPEYLVKSIDNRLREAFCCQDSRIVLLDTGMANTAKEAARQLCAQCDRLYLCERGEVAQWLAEKFHLQIDP